MTSAKVRRGAECVSQVLPEHDDASARLAEIAVEALRSDARFRHRTDTIQVDCLRERLIVTGRIPTFYLKQLLQEVLRHVDGVREIDNRVDVISCDGLSSAIGR